MKCNPLQMARTCTKSVLTPLECLDVSKINSYPLSSLEPILVSSTPLSLKFFDQFLPPQKCQDMPKSNLYPFNVSELSSNHFEASSKVPEFVPNQRKPLLKSLDLSQIGFNPVHWLFQFSSNPLQCTRTYPKLTLTPSEVHGLVPNQIYPFQTVQLCPKEVLTSPKCLNLCQIHCDPSKVSELVTNQFYIPQKCQDWSQISSNPLQNPKTFPNQFYLLPVLISCNSL